MLYYDFFASLSATFPYWGKVPRLAAQNHSLDSDPDLRDSLTREQTDLGELEYRILWSLGLETWESLNLFKMLRLEPLYSGWELRLTASWDDAVVY
jgi:hypothetical protein